MASKITSGKRLAPNQVIQIYRFLSKWEQFYKQVFFNYVVVIFGTVLWERERHDDIKD